MAEWEKIAEAAQRARRKTEDPILQGAFERSTIDALPEASLFATALGDPADIYLRAFAIMVARELWGISP